MILLGVVRRERWEGVVRRETWEGVVVEVVVAAAAKSKEMSNHMGK